MIRLPNGKRDAICLGGCRAARIVLRNKECDFLLERRWKVREVSNCRSKRNRVMRMQSWQAGNKHRQLSEGIWFTAKGREIEP